MSRPEVKGRSKEAEVRKWAGGFQTENRAEQAKDAVKNPKKKADRQPPKEARLITEETVKNQKSERRPNIYTPYKSTLAV